MQYVEGKLTATRGWFHPVDRLSSMVSEVDSERVHQMLLLDDGTITALHEFSGDRRLVEWAAEELPEVLDYQISPLEGPILVYAHIEATELLSSLLEMPHNYRVVPDFPIEYVGEGVVRLRVVGDRDVIKEAIYSLPDGIEPEVETIARYAPEPDRLRTQLTDRQQEVANVAVELGYYDTPRQVTYDDVAEAVDVTPGTVGEILRKVESQLLNALFG